MGYNASTTGQIAIVDDDKDIGLLLQRPLCAAGWAVDHFASGADFSEAFDPLRYDCVVLDLMLPDTSGLELLASLRAQGCRVPVIVISAYCDIPSAVRALHLGALEVLPKPVSIHALAEVVREAVEQAAQLRREQARTRAAASRLATLTEREGEVLQLMLAGITSREIADRLGISARTVEAHRTRVMRKMEAESPVGLVCEYLLATRCNPIDLLTDTARPPVGRH